MDIQTQVIVFALAVTLAAIVLYAVFGRCRHPRARRVALRQYGQVVGEECMACGRVWGWWT